MEDKNNRSEEGNDEFRIIDDDPLELRLPYMKMVKKEVIIAGCDPGEMLAKYGIEGNRYSLDKLDENGIEELSAFIASNPSIPEAEGISSILDRAKCNCSFSIMEPGSVDAMFENAPECGSIYACNTILDSLAYMLGITETVDTASYALCILLAIRKGIIADDELDDVTELFAFRNLCATEIRVKPPGQECIGKWKAILYRLTALMFGEASERNGDRTE